MSPSRSIFTRLLSALLFLALSSQLSNVHAADPKLSPRELRSKAETAASKGEMNTAIHFYSALIDAEKSQINYFHRANLYLKRHQYAHALSDLREAIELDPKFLKGRMLRAKIFKVTGQCDKALTELKDILAQQATHKEATTELPKVQTCVQLVQQANAMLASQQWESAKHFLTQALDIAYESNILLSSRVRCHASLRDWQSVIVDTRRILQSTKTDMDALYLRGQAYYYLGEHESALTHWKEGLRLDPEHKLTKEATKKLRLLVRRIANAEASLNSNPQEAMEDIDLALEMDPHHTEIRPGLKLKKCEALKNLKRWKELIDLATELIEADENSIEAWIKRAEGKMGLEEWEQAIHDYTKATQLNNGHQGAQQGLHQAQVELKKSQQKDFYKELGIPRNANARQIKKAYRKLAMMWHPDKHVNDADKDTAAKKFQAIAEAYEVLSDPEMRGKYDRGEEWKPNQGGGQQHHHHGHPFHFQQGFGGGHGFHQQHHFRWG